MSTTAGKEAAALNIEIENTRIEQKANDHDEEKSSGLSTLKLAAKIVASEERVDVAEVFKKADTLVNKQIEEEELSYDQTFDDDEKNNGSDVGKLLSQISEDIHYNKIESDLNDVEKILQEAAQEIQNEEKYSDAEASDSSQNDSDEEEEVGDSEKNVELIICASQGNEKRVRWLLEHGASINARDRHGWTALHWASSRGHHEVVSLLLETAGSFRTKKYVNKKDELSGWTALHVRVAFRCVCIVFIVLCQVAVIAAHVNCIKLLVAHNAKVNKRNLVGEKPVDCIPYSKSMPEYGICLRALGLERKIVSYAIGASSSSNRK